MHMIAKRRHGVDDVDDIASKIARMRSSKAHALNPRDRSDCRQQLSKGFDSRGITIRVHVLAEQLNLGIAEVHQLSRFVKNRSGSPAALLAPSIRNHAIGAELIAALNDRDVSAMRIRARRKLGLKALVGHPIVESGNPRLAGLE